MRLLVIYLIENKYLIMLQLYQNLFHGFIMDRVPAGSQFLEQTLTNLTAPTTILSFFDREVEFGGLRFGSTDRERASAIALSLGDAPTPTKLVHILAEKAIRLARETSLSPDSTIKRTYNSKDYRALGNVENAQAIFDKYKGADLARANPGKLINEVTIPDALIPGFVQSPEYVKTAMKRIHVYQKEIRSLQQTQASLIAQKRNEVIKIESTLLKQEKAFNQNTCSEANFKEIWDQFEAATDPKICVEAIQETSAKIDTLRGAIAQIQEPFATHNPNSEPAKLVVEEIAKPQTHRRAIDMIESMQKALDHSSPALLHLVLDEMTLYTPIEAGSETLRDEFEALLPDDLRPQIRTIIQTADFRRKGDFESALTQLKAKLIK